MRGRGGTSFPSFGTPGGFWETKKQRERQVQTSPVGFLARAFCYIAWEIEGARQWPTHSA